MNKRLFYYIKYQPLNFQSLIEESKKLKMFLINETKTYDNSLSFEFKTVIG